MSDDIHELARRLASEAEAVCRRYLPAGRREGGHWRVGDLRNSPGRSLYVRLTDAGKGAVGRWTDYVAPRFMLRIFDWALFHGRLTASTQHNFSVSRGAA